MNHNVHDQISREIARTIAAGLHDHPEWIEIASANLDRWSAQNADAPGLVRCYAQWQKLLHEPVDEIIRVLTGESQECGRMRQNSPFVGVLPLSEIRNIKRRFLRADTHETTTA